MPEDEKGTPQNEQNQKQNKFQNRINKLYGQKKEAEEMTANLESENQNLRSQMTDLQEKISTLEGRNDDQGNQTGLEKPANDGNAGNLDADSIKHIVQDTVGNILNQRDEQVQKQNKLHKAQQDSWRGAVEDMPELGDKNSELYQAAQRVWEKDEELRNSTSGPFKAAMLAKGFLGPDAVPKEKLQSAQMQNTGNQILDNGGSGKEIKELDTQIADLQSKMANGEPIQRVWPAFRDLRAKRAELVKQQNNKK